MMQEIRKSLIQVRMRYLVVFLCSTIVTLIHLYEKQLLCPTGTFDDWVCPLTNILFIIPFAILADKTSAKLSIIAVLSLKVIAVVAPCYSIFGFYAYMVAGFRRIFLEGTTAGLYPIIYVLLSKWAPPNERSLMASIIFSGIPLGSLIGLITGLPWFRQANYIFVALCILWMIIWCILVQNSPKDQKKIISQDEKKFIQESLGISTSEEHVKKPKFPFKKILTSKPFLALLFIHCGFASQIHIRQNLLRYVPSNPSLTFRWFFDENDQIFIRFAFMIFIGAATTVLLNKKHINITNARRLITTAGIAVIILSTIQTLLTSNKGVHLLMKLISNAIIGTMYSGFLINHLDLSPTFAGTLFSITTTIANLVDAAGFIMFRFYWRTITTGILPMWIIASVTGAFTIIGIIFYWFYCCGEEQSWSKIETDGYVNVEKTSPLFPVLSDKEFSSYEKKEVEETEMDNA